MPHDERRPPRPPEKPTVPNQLAVTSTLEARFFRPTLIDASPEEREQAWHEMAAAHATVNSFLTHRIPGIEERIDQVLRNQVAERVHRERIEEELRELGETVRRLSSRVGALESKAAIDRVSGLPPMRPEFTSSHDLAKHLGQEVAAKVDAEQKNPTTPPPDMAKVAAISQDVMQPALDKIKAGWWDKLEAERKAAEADRREADKLNDALKRDIRLRTWIAVLAIATTVITAIVTTLIATHH